MFSPHFLCKKMANLPKSNTTACFGRGQSNFQARTFSPARANIKEFFFVKKWENASNTAKAICPPPNHSIAGLFTLHISDVFVLPPRMHSIVLHVSIVKYRSPELVKRCNCFLFLQTTFLPQACPISYQLNLSNDIHLLMKFWDQPIKQYPKCTYSGKRNVITNSANA